MDANTADLINGLVSGVIGVVILLGGYGLGLYFGWALLGLIPGLLGFLAAVLVTLFYWSAGRAISKFFFNLAAYSFLQVARS